MLFGSQRLFDRKYRPRRSLKTKSYYFLHLKQVWNYMKQDGLVSLYLSLYCMILVSLLVQNCHFQAVAGVGA